MESAMMPIAGIALPESAKVSNGSNHGVEVRGVVGKHVLVEFDNGYTLSIIDTYGSYGVEAGLIYPDGSMPLENPVFGHDAVEGWLTPSRLAEIIERVSSL